jgi:hypothetical protein
MRGGGAWIYYLKACRSLLLTLNMLKVGPIIWINQWMNASGIYAALKFRWYILLKEGLSLVI